MESSKFTKNIVKALESLGGEALLPEIYKEFEKICNETGLDLKKYDDYNGVKNWKASIRRRLQQHSSSSGSYVNSNPDLFVGPSSVKKGLWALKDNKKSVYVIAYYLSKYLDYNGEKNHSYRSLGFSTRKEAAQVIAHRFNEKESNVKNFEDVFDPIHDNHRKGWYQKPLPKQSKRIVELFEKFSKKQLEDYVKKLLNNEEEMTKKIKNKGNEWKKASEKQENELYDFFLKLGFNEKYLGKRVHFQSPGFESEMLKEFNIKNAKPEIDVIAKNGNNLFICHCSGNKTMKNLLQRQKELPFIHSRIVEYLKNPLISDHEKWKVDEKTNVILIFDVKGNEVGTGEKIRENMKKYPNLYGENAELWDTEFRNYYLNELKIDKDIARNWLMYVCGVSETEEKAEFEAVKVNYGLGVNTKDSYLFTADVESFYRHAFVQQRRPYKHSADYYQRLLKVKRMDDIGEYLNSGKAYFPNNIVVNIENPDDAITFIPQKINVYDEKTKREKTIDHPSYGTIRFNKRCCAHVIDGQHRLFSYLKTNKNIRENAKIVVNALQVSTNEEHEFFVKINDEQKAIDQELIWDLKGEMYKDASDGKISRTWKKINVFDEDSYFYHLIKYPSFKAPVVKGKVRTQYLSLGGLCRVTQDKFKSIYGNPNTAWGKNFFYFENLPDKRSEQTKRLALIISDFFGRLYENLDPDFQKKYLHDGGKQKIQAGVHFVLLDVCRFTIKHFKVNKSNFGKSKEINEFFDILSKCIKRLGLKNLTGQGQYTDYLKDLVAQLRSYEKLKDFAKPEIDLEVDDKFREEYIEKQFEIKMNTLLQNIFAKMFGNDYIEQKKTFNLYKQEQWMKAKNRNEGIEDIDMQFQFDFSASRIAFFKSKFDVQLEECILEIFDGPFVNLKDFNTAMQTLWDYNINCKHPSGLKKESKKYNFKSPDAYLKAKYSNKVLIEYKKLAEKVLTVFDNIAEKEGFTYDQ